MWISRMEQYEKSRKPKTKSALCQQEINSGHKITDTSLLDIVKIIDTESRDIHRKKWKGYIIEWRVLVVTGRTALISPCWVGWGGTDHITGNHEERGCLCLYPRARQLLAVENLTVITLFLIYCSCLNEFIIESCNYGFKIIWWSLHYKDCDCRFAQRYYFDSP